MKSTIKKGEKDEKLFLIMSNRIENLRKAIWRAIHKNKEDLSDCDISMALGIVNYELIHHSKD